MLNEYCDSCGKDVTHIEDKGFVLGYEAALEEVEKIIEKISFYESEVNPLITIGRENAINDLDNELKQLKQKKEMK